MSDFFARQSKAFENDLRRSMSALLGIAQGLVCDKNLNDDEVRFLNAWLTENENISLVRPGDSIPNRLTSPGTPCRSGPSRRKSGAGSCGPWIFGRTPL